MHSSDADPRPVFTPTFRSPSCWVTSELPIILSIRFSSDFATQGDVSQPIETTRLSSPALIWVYVNRKAGAFNWDAVIAELIERLRADGHQVELESDPDQFLARLGALDSPDELPDLLISAGGDGTAAALVNSTAAEIPVAIFPIGTENVYAKYLGITTFLDDFIEMLRAGRTIRVDVGKLNGRIFLLMCGSGFDAQVVREVHQNRTGHITKFHYVPSVLWQLYQYAYPLLDIEMELEGGETLRTEGRWCFVFNIARYALNIRMAPEALPHDGLFDVCVLNRGGFWSMLGYSWSVLWRRLGKHPHARVYRARKVSIRPPEGIEIPVQVDGDPAGLLPIDIEVLPGALQLLVPARFSVATA